MRDLTQAEVKAIADAAGVEVPDMDLAMLTVRLNGMIEVVKFLETIPQIDETEPVPTLLTQRGGA